MSLADNQSIQRAMALLRAVADAPDGATPVAVATRTGIPRPTVIRLLATMVRCGLLTRDNDAPRYRVGYEVVRIARQADPHGPLIERCRSAMERLAEDTGETATLSVPISGPRLETVFQINGLHIVRDHDWVGRELPLHATSNGKVLLAHLSDPDLGSLELTKLAHKTITSVSSLRSQLATVRKNGYAMSLDEYENGLSGLAAPVRAVLGQLTAIVTVSGPSFRFSEAARTQHLERLRTAASEMGETLGVPMLSDGRPMATSGIVRDHGTWN